jgi:hypothetical protein
MNPPPFCVRHLHFKIVGTVGVKSRAEAWSPNRHNHGQSHGESVSQRALNLRLHDTVEPRSKPSGLNVLKLILARCRFACDADHLPMHQVG